MRGFFPLRLDDEARWKKISVNKKRERSRKHWWIKKVYSRRDQGNTGGGQEKGENIEKKTVRAKGKNIAVST
jgi:hypothetical protein